MVTVGAVVFLTLVGATAALAKAPPGDCGWDGLVQPFTSWNDSGSYFMVPGASFEGDMNGWAMNGTSIVAGNESYDVNSPTDSQSLSIPTGAGATTPLVCV